VQVLDLAPTNVVISLDFIGQLDSPQNVEVRARVEAFVEDILFAEGKDVQKDQLLFQLDKKPLLEQLAAAKGALAEANAALNKYEKDVARLLPLAKAQAIPKQDLDNAMASVEIGKASVASAQARVDSTLLNLEYCDVRAPVPGLIGAKQVTVGSLVGKGQPTLLATISTLDPIWFYCAISEVDYLRSQRRMAEAGISLEDLDVKLILADGSEHPAPGKWVFLDRAVDVTTGTIRARAQFNNPGQRLRPGMFARARMDVRLPKPSIVVPERAVVELQGQYFVWVVGADNQASQRQVEVSPQKLGEGVIILEGLKPGERIVTEGLQKVHEGATVQPMTAAQIAAQKAAAAVKGATHPGAAGSGKE
jgi:membrane fusion protein (multidrug efflux system)